MSEKDKNKIDNAKLKKDIQEENSILLSDDEKNEDESVEVTETKQQESNESLKHSANSPQVLYNTNTSYLSELDEKQQQFILSNSQKITESLNLGSPNSKLEILSNSTKNHNEKLKDLLLRSSPISKQQIQRQIAEVLIGIRSEEEKIYQLTQELVRARDIINQLRDSLSYSDDEKVQLQKEFDCFQDKVEIERLNWKNEFKKIKEIQAQDYNEKVQLSNYIKEMEENIRKFHENELKNKKAYQETVYQLQESQEGYNQLESDFNLLSKKYKELEQYLMKLKQSNENIIQENKLLKDSNQELMIINDDLKKGNKQLIQMNKSLEEENRKIEASKESFYKEESENMASKMQEVMQKNHEYISQLNKMKSVQDVIENEYNEIKSLLNEERNKNDQCESELTVFGRRIRTLLEQNNKLNKENDRIRTELRNLQFNPPLGKSDTPNDNRISFNSDIVNDFPSSSKIRNNLVSYSTYSVPKNLRNSNSATDLKNVKWATISNISNDNIEDTYKTNIRSSFKNSNIPIYTNNNKNQSIPSSSNTNYGWDNNSYSPTPSSSSYSNSPKKYLKNRSSSDMQLNNVTSKIPINTSNNMNNNHNTYMNTITKMSPKELENLLRSLTLRKDQLQSEYVKVPSSNKRRKEILEEKLDEVEKQMGGCRMRLKALKVM